MNSLFTVQYRIKLNLINHVTIVQWSWIASLRQVTLPTGSPKATNLLTKVLRAGQTIYHQNLIFCDRIHLDPIWKNRFSINLRNMSTHTGYLMTILKSVSSRILFNYNCILTRLYTSFKVESVCSISSTTLFCGVLCAYITNQ